ncbi:flagellar hook-length control protein FliK [Noviherbaspirillum galbum]|uniref:Flagellar hook-length control protein-like C-terminal domain-containing protein n=1 Tax=Noviherbaspirillum galbum TaxID=2709383 RepID=A0A6B3SPL8_9BURK|nr:flagellar hook-length control protein FliK [Noviherbaspirillum galbum]NEX62693.1 hypothetical protein [Noviherbaspirillum galbum]
MQTNNANLVNPLLANRPAPSPSPRAAEPETPAQPFNQVLSREMADRAPSVKDAPKDPSPAQRASGNDKAVAAKNKSDDPAKDEGENAGNADSAAATATTDMLALVASAAGTVAALDKAKADSQQPADASAQDATAAGTALAIQGGQQLASTPDRPDAARVDAESALRLAKADVRPAAPLATSQSAASIPALATAQPAAKAVDAGAANARASSARLDVNPDAREALKSIKPADAGAEAPQSQTAATGESATPQKPFDSALQAGKLAQATAKEDRELPLARQENVAAPQGLAQQLQQTQQAPALQAIATVAARADTLTARVGTPAWDQALGQKITWMVAGQEQSASLTLNPPDLGPLQVVLSVSNSQANATFTAAQPEVRQALEAALPKLRDMLGDAGIQLGQATVSSGNPQQQQQAQGDPGRQATAGGSLHRAQADAVRADPVARASRTVAGSSGRGMVDTFA